MNAATKWFGRTVVVGIVVSLAFALAQPGLTWARGTWPRRTDEPQPRARTEAQPCPSLPGPP